MFSLELLSNVAYFGGTLKSLHILNVINFLHKLTNSTFLESMDHRQSSSLFPVCICRLDPLEPSIPDSGTL